MRIRSVAVQFLTHHENWGAIHRSPITTSYPPATIHTSTTQARMIRAVNETSRSFTMPGKGLKSTYWSLKGLSQLRILV